MVLVLSAGAVTLIRENVASSQPWTCMWDFGLLVTVKLWTVRLLQYSKVRICIMKNFSMNCLICGFVRKESIECYNWWSWTTFAWPPRRTKPIDQSSTSVYCQSIYLWDGDQTVLIIITYPWILRRCNYFPFKLYQKWGKLSIEIEKNTRVINYI